MSEGDDCKTPGWLYKALDAEFKFDLDPCPIHGKGGLELDWDGRRVFCNPPYTDIRPWVEKALSSTALVVFLLPKRLDAAWGQMLFDCGAEFRFLRRSFCFARAGGGQGHPIGGSMVVIVKRFGLLKAEN